MSLANKMHIGIVTDSINQHSDGIGKYGFNILKQLANRSEIIITTIDRYSKPFLAAYRVNEFILPCHFPILKAGLWRMGLPARVQNAKLNLDFIIDFSGLPLAIGNLHKWIFVVHDLSDIFYPSWYPSGHLKAVYQRALLQNLFRKIGGIITVSEFTKQEIIKHFEITSEKITVAYPATALSYIDENHEEQSLQGIDRPFFLSVGTISPRKNISAAIRSFEIFCQRQGATHNLVIAGQLGWKYHDVISAIESSNFRSNIFILKRITNSNLRFLYEHATALLYPSFYEGFGMPIVEAMLLGCPVLASPTTGMVEAGGSALISIQPNDDFSIADAMLRIAKANHALRQNIINTGRLWVKKFNWELTVDKILNYAAQLNLK